MFPYYNSLATICCAAYTLFYTPCLLLYTMPYGEPWRGTAYALETTMSTLIGATLYIALETAQVYRVLYTVSDSRGGSVTLYSIRGQETLREALTQCEIAPPEVDRLLTRLESAMSYVLDLGHLDTAQVARILLRHAGG